MSLTKLKILIVDDEPHARELLELSLQKTVRGIEVVGKAANTESAEKLISSTKPDVVFLDIEMPEKSGIEFLQEQKDIDYYPVIVTSHAEYAIEAVKASALDYLLKPVDPDELKQCILKVRERRSKVSDISVSAEGPRKLALKNVSNITYVPIQDIYAVRAAGSYSEVLTMNGAHTVSQNLKHFEDALATDRFMRVHNSHLINLNEVVEFIHQGSYAVLSNGERFIVSTKNKDEFKSRMEAG